MLKKTLSLLLMLCLLTSAYALAEPVNVTLLTQAENQQNNFYLSGGAAIGDTVYVLTDKSLLRWTPGDAQATPITMTFVYGDSTPAEEGENTATEQKPAFSKLLSDGQTLYGLDMASGKLWKLTDANGPLEMPVLAVQLKWDNMNRTSSGGDYTYTPQNGEMTMTGGMLYYAMIDWERQDKPYNIYGWDLTTGEQTMDTPDVPMRTLTPYKDGLLIGKLYDDMNSWDETTQTQRMPQLATFDPKTGEAKVLLDFTDSSIYGVRYNAQTDTLYYVQGATVYKLSDLSQPATISAYLPNRVWDDVSVALLPSGMYAVINYDGLTVRGLDMPGIENGALTIYGEYGSAGHQAFVAQYPQTPVTISDQYYDTLEQFTAAMVSGSNTVDVLRLNSDYAPLNRLIDKGYATDLSAYPGITEVVSRMDPKLVNLCMRDGKLYGLPIDVSGNAFGYNKAAWKELSLTEDDLPTTFSELLDFVANWQADYAEDHTDLMLTDSGQTRDTLVSWLMDAYVAEQIRAGQPIAFDTDLFRSLMKQIEAIDFSEIDVPPEEQDDSFWNRMSVFSPYTSVTYPQQFRYDTVFLSLPLTEGLEPIMPATVEYLVINPRTTHLDQAVQYLSVFGQNLDPAQAGITLFPDNNEPVPNPTFEQDKVEWQATLDEYKAQLATAKPEDQASIKDTIASYEQLLADAESDRYSVSAEDIATYRQKAAPYLMVTGQTPLKTWNKEGKNEFYALRDQYMQGAIPLDQFIKEMDKRLRMMQLEDE